jgi:probable rRNA maturation factor
MPEQPAVDVTVNVEVGEAEVDTEMLRAAVLRTLSDHPGGGELSLTLVDDRAIRAINREYLGKDRVTDVIAFCLGGGGVLLGDVYVGLEQARRQAAEYGVDEPEELVRLAVHGTLHVLGHDHPEGEDRFGSPMFDLQERLVREILAS